MVHLCSNLSQLIHPIPLPCVLAFPPPSHRDATTPSPCWAPHFMTHEHIMFSNPTPSEPRLSPAATMSDATPSALTPPLHCTSICCSLQHLLKLSLSSLRPSLLQFVSIVSPLLNHGNSIFEPVCVFYLQRSSSSVFTFLIEMSFSFKSLFAIWSLLPQRFHYYLFLSIVSWQYQKYSIILILVLCLLCVTQLVCSSYSSFAPSSPFFSS